MNIDTFSVNRLVTGQVNQLEPGVEDISGHAQLLATVHSVDGEAIRENLFCKALTEKITGEDIFRITTQHLEQW